MKNLIVLTSAALFLLGMASCKKCEPSCYDAALAEKSKELICSADCPGVVGCDGKTYCNECEANRQKIRVK